MEDGSAEIAGICVAAEAMARERARTVLEALEKDLEGMFVSLRNVQEIVYRIPVAQARNSPLLVSCHYQWW